MANDTCAALAGQWVGSNSCYAAVFTEQIEKTGDNILWSNFLVDAPIVYSLMERRLLYFLTLQVKHRFTEKNLGVPDSWKELYFQMTDADLGQIGGKTRILQTYEALSKIGEKFVPIRISNKNGKTINGKVHWVDAFFYNSDTETYEVRVSPEIMPYLINLTKSFTTFNAKTAMLLTSKFGQKFYELCSQFSTDYQHIDKQGRRYKKNVIPIDIENFRRIFNLEDVIDPRTKKIITKGKYKNFNDIRRRVIEPSLTELYDLYIAGRSNVWFDYMLEKTGRKITRIYLFIYSHNHPKEDSIQPWTEGDKPLCPFEEVNFPVEVKKVKGCSIVEELKDCSIEQLQVFVETVLNRYLKPSETQYCIRYTKTLKHNLHDAFMQILQVVRDKEQQSKFSSGTAAYKRKSILQFALNENLKEFGWNIPAPKSQNTIQMNFQTVI